MNGQIKMNKIHNAEYYPSRFVKSFEENLMGLSKDYDQSIALIEKSIYRRDLEVLKSLTLNRIVHEGTAVEQASLLTICQKLNVTPENLPKEALYYMVFVMKMSLISYPILQNKDYYINIEYYDTSNPLKVLKISQIFDSRSMKPVKMEVPSVVNLIKVCGKYLKIRALSEEDIYYSEFHYKQKMKEKRNVAK